MKRYLIAVLLSMIATLSTASSFAQTQIDLGHPTLTPVTFTVANVDLDRDHSIAFDVLQDFSINSAGMKFDPRPGDGTIRAIIREVDTSAGGVGTRSNPLASATALISDQGMEFYDVPIDFTFTAGKRYDIAFDSDWGDRLTTFEAYLFDPTRAGYAPYDVGDLVTVVDGGQNFFRAGGGYTNTGMNHFRFNAFPVVPFSASEFGPPMGKKKKIGSTIPIKFQLFLQNDGGDPVQVISQEMLDAVLQDFGLAPACPEICLFDATYEADLIGIELPEDNTNTGEGGDLGHCFRFDEQGSCIFNLDLEPLTFEPGGTYFVSVKIGPCTVEPGNFAFQTK